MSSFTRTIQRTIGRDEDGHQIAVRRQFGGRGGKLGVVNPRDPCRTKVKAKPKLWRAKDKAPPAKPKVNMGAPVRAEIDRNAAHKDRMARKAARRQRTYEQIGGMSPGNPKMNRHTGKPHEHAAEKARRMRQAKEAKT